MLGDLRSTGRGASVELQFCSWNDKLCVREQVDVADVVVVEVRDHHLSDVPRRDAKPPQRVTGFDHGGSAAPLPDVAGKTRVDEDCVAARRTILKK